MMKITRKIKSMGVGWLSNKEIKHISFKKAFRQRLKKFTKDYL